MASTIMMQSICNNTNQMNDNLGMYASQYAQVNNYNYGSSFDSNSANSPAAINPTLQSDFAGGAMFVHPQSLPLPQMQYSSSVSPQMMPLGYPAISPPMMQLMDMNMPSVSPPSSTVGTMGGFIPAAPMMGYSMLPIPATQANLTYVGLPQATASLSPEMGYLMPEMTGYQPQATPAISRSVSPCRSEETLVLPQIPTRDSFPTRERNRSIGSTGSTLSLDSDGAPISKKELVENCLKQIDQIFGHRVQTTGMRGPTVMRIKVKTRPALELIIDLLRTLEQTCVITAISCPKSTKKGKQHIRGFLAYIKTNHVANIDQVQRVFDEFNGAHTKGDVAPFKTLEVNPQKKN